MKTHAKSGQAWRGYDCARKVEPSVVSTSLNAIKWYKTQPKWLKKDKKMDN
ncbi:MULTISPECIES: hypothetical protein [Serratia]|uniref:hypothetical protein n=1 Tax=Serratia TaxID=613 RepID=UPI0029D9FB2B|nr:hypothetical protein [Serratia marcescens]MDX7543770.1 hypothetical protein [Serratia marcescens]MDX7565399.1 hypothetical protein [Serratia marcescens]